MPADMENATDLAIPPTVRYNQPIQLNYQNELASQDIINKFHCFDCKGNQMHKHEEQNTPFPIVSRKGIGLVKMF